MTGEKVQIAQCREKYMTGPSPDPACSKLPYQNLSSAPHGARVQATMQQLEGM